MLPLLVSREDPLPVGSLHPHGGILGRAGAALIGRVRWTGSGAVIARVGEEKGQEEQGTKEGFQKGVWHEGLLNGRRARAEHAGSYG